ncbi:plasma membrane [Chlorella sorokiniana]|uniref:Plasma membrane n=1 Tax=Chlorella sorokiniana TaxID=3076 RepID=A0A2P6TKE1_CHLSO|nr:plasma membrane [Chlorella sorokiniana]|eukprot:PRW44508.1 plasma membrane [Chlorella sorokiniana]
MALQNPHSPAAERRTFAGPWLRFGSGTSPLDGTAWIGSVLCLTRGAGLAAAAAAPSSGAGSGGLNGGTAQAGYPPAGVAAVPTAASPGLTGAAASAGAAPRPVLLLRDSRSGSGGDGGERRLDQPTALDSCEGWTAWRFELELSLTEWQRPVDYCIQAGGQATPTYTFWLPAVGQPMHWGYYSCNGMSDDVKPNAPERKDPTYLWRDLLQLHSAFPLHCLVGGGDQLYNDGVWQTPALKAWGANTDHDKKVEAEWTAQMQQEATHYYLTNYIDAFSAADVDVAMASIPSIMMWDDHDIWDGYGSYEPKTQGCHVFQGLFKVARRFFLLFQQHTTDAFNTQRSEFLTNDNTEFHYLKYMGPQVAVLGMDMRSQRTKERIMPQASYELFRRTVAALPPGPLHLVVLSGIPLIFPKIPAVETVLGCMGRITRSVPALKNAARSSGLLDRFDQPEILDDLRDGWVADVHEEERLQFIRMLQEFSLTKGLRVSILSGDAHVGGVGRLYSRPKIKDVGEDPLFMPQIISSAIVNAPPPHPVVKMLMRTNFASNVDERTREKLVRAFYPYHPRIDKLIAQRNWCDVSLVAPPFSPPTVPADPLFGGLRFTLRVENTDHRRGYADEVYVIVVPRHPSAAKTVTAAGAAPAGVPLALPPASPVMEEELQATREQQVASRPGEGAAGGTGGAQWGMAVGKAVGSGAPEPATLVATV